jgi:hypothetical protein
MSAIQDKGSDFTLFNTQVGFALKDLFHSNAVHLFVALCPGRPHSRAATRIQESKLYANSICHLTHDTPESIDLTNKMAFRDAPNRGITGHLSDEINVHRNHRGFEAHAGTGPGGLTTGVTSTDYHHIELLLH